jgi:hypothetical protein
MVECNVIWTHIEIKLMERFTFLQLESVFIARRPSQLLLQTHQPFSKSVNNLQVKNRNLAITRSTDRSQRI